MNSFKRPNQDALYQALNIYRDAMRPFILGNLKTMQDLPLEYRFQNEADIDVGDFPHLFRKYWNKAFEQRFDPDRDIRSAIGIITETRNKVAHPGTEDISSEYTLSRLYEIADILGQINVPEQKREVEAIRDKLLARTAPTVETKPKLLRRKAAYLTLSNTIAHILEHKQHLAEANEATTQQYVVLPILRALGWDDANLARYGDTARTCCEGWKCRLRPESSEENLLYLSNAKDGANHLKDMKTRLSTMPLRREYLLLGLPTVKYGVSISRGERVVL